MATKKTMKKKTTTTTKATAEAETQRIPNPTVKTADGEVEVKDGDIIKVKEDGTCEFKSKESLLNADGIIISVRLNDETLSYPVKIKRCENGNIFLAFATAKGMDSVKAKIDKVKSLEKDDLVCLIGRGQNMEAMFAAQTCWDGYARSFGIANSYSLVRLELEKEGKQWVALFVPVLNVMG